MCYEPRNEEFAKVCRERDELKKLLEMARGERDVVTKRMIELEQENAELKVERDALLCIVKNWGECEHCKHLEEKLPEEDCVPGEQSCYLCTMEKIPCCECSVENRWEWRGVKT